MIEGLFVAGRGAAASDGLHYFYEIDGEWKGAQLATAEELASLCWHPTLPVVYGLSGLGSGLLHVWDVTAVPVGPAIETDTVDCQGEIPCDLSVDPSGRLLVAANFGTGTLAVWTLDAAGRPQGDGETIVLEGGTVADMSGKPGSHPHQVVFSGGLLYVPDYGADLVRVFAVDAATAKDGRGAAALRELPGIPAPAGTSPRHMVVLPTAMDGAPRAAVSGENSSTILLGPLAGDSPESWALRVGTDRTGTPRSRHARNYPGDIKLSADGATAFFANRGYDTISAFDVTGGEPRLVWEVDSGVLWPQHLLLRGDQLLVAGWDSNTVTALSLAGGEPGETAVLFSCDGAGWLLADRERA